MSKLPKPVNDLDRTFSGGVVRHSPPGGEGDRHPGPCIVTDEPNPIRVFCATCGGRFTTRNTEQTICEHCTLKEG